MHILQSQLPSFNTDQPHHRRSSCSDISALFCTSGSSYLNTMFHSMRTCFSRNKPRLALNSMFSSQCKKVTPISINGRKSYICSHNLSAKSQLNTRPFSSTDPELLCALVERSGVGLDSYKSFMYKVTQPNLQRKVFFQIWG